VPHDLTKKNLMDQISICESLLRRNKTNYFWNDSLQATKNESRIIYNNVRKRLWSKQDEAPQTVVKPGLTSKKVMLYSGIGKESFTTSCCPVKRLIFNLYYKNWKNYAAKQSRATRIDQYERVIFYHDNARLHTSLVIRQ